MPVLEWMCTFLSKFASRHQRVQIQDLERLAENDLRLVKAVLKGVRVTVSVPAGRRPARPIKDLVPNVGNYHFMKEDEETTIKVRFVILLSPFLTASLRIIMTKNTTSDSGIQDYSAFVSTSSRKQLSLRKFAP